MSFPKLGAGPYQIYPSISKKTQIAKPGMGL
jgi:hypothetical protein